MAEPTHGKLVSLWRVTCGSLSLLTGSFLATILIFLILKFFMVNAFADLHHGASGVLVHTTEHKMTAIDKTDLERLIQAGVIITPDMLLDTMSGFYNSMLGWFTLLITVSGLIAFIYIKGVSVQQADMMITKRVDELTNKLSFVEKIVEEVATSSSFNNFLSDVERSTMTQGEQIVRLESTLTLLADTISRMQPVDRSQQLDGSAIPNNAFSSSDSDFSSSAGEE